MEKTPEPIQEIDHKTIEAAVETRKSAEKKAMQHRYKARAVFDDWLHPASRGQAEPASVGAAPRKAAAARTLDRALNGSMRVAVLNSVDLGSNNSKVGPNGLRKRELAAKRLAA